MQTQTTDRNIEPIVINTRSQVRPSCIPPAVPRPARRGRAALPLRRRESCLTKRALLAALREAEFYEWMATGGDFLDSTLQPVG